MSALFPPRDSGRRIGYARVSTDKQTLYQYTDALKQTGCRKQDIFTDDATSALIKDQGSPRPASRASGAQAR